jgi:hypothetical protein
MKLTVNVRMERTDGTHEGKISFEIPDDLMGNPIGAMVAGLPISAELLDGIIFLIAHVDDEEEPDIPVPEAFRRAFD